jgi:hypothetical protein
MRVKLSVGNRGQWRRLKVDKVDTAFLRSPRSGLVPELCDGGQHEISQSSGSNSEHVKCSNTNHNMQISKNLRGMADRRRVGQGITPTPVNAGYKNEIVTQTPLVP